MEQVATLMIVLRKDAADVRVLDVECGDHLDLDGERYEALRTDGYFFDWLRTSTGDWIGVRFWASEVPNFVTEALRWFPYCVQHARYVEIFFGHDRSVDLASSNAQEFGPSGFFVSQGGDLALALGIDRSMLSWLKSARSGPVLAI